MLSLQQHLEAESARWAASRRTQTYSASITSSSSSSSSSVFSSSPLQLHSKYNTHRLSRRSSTSSFATEFEPEPAGQQPFVVPRDFNGAPITVYASLEAAVAQSTRRLLLEGAGVGVGEEQQQQQQQQPRRLVTPGKLYENEEDDDEIVYA
jgi:hypothetical protein